MSPGRIAFERYDTRNSVFGKSPIAEIQGKKLNSVGDADNCGPHGGNA